jgi:hypothetical protein
VELKQILSADRVFIWSIYVHLTSCSKKVTVTMRFAYMACLSRSLTFSSVYLMRTVFCWAYILNWPVQIGWYKSEVSLLLLLQLLCFDLFARMDCNALFFSRTSHCGLFFIKREKDMLQNG